MVILLSCAWGIASGLCFERLSHALAVGLMGSVVINLVMHAIEACS